MCLLRRRQLDPKSRRLMAAGNLCLASGLMLTHFEEGLGHHHSAIFDGLRFLLIGLAIGLIVWSVRRNCGCASRT
jgi:hypothetical protein